MHAGCRTQPMTFVTYVPDLTARLFPQPTLGRLSDLPSSRGDSALRVNAILSGAPAGTEGVPMLRRFGCIEGETTPLRAVRYICSAPRLDCALR